MDYRKKNEMAHGYQETPASNRNAINTINNEV